MAFGGTQHMPPSEGQESSTTAFLHGSAHRRHGYSDADELVVSVAILDARYQIEVKHRQVFLHILVYLPWCELREAIEVLVCVVDEIEDLITIAFTDILPRKLFHMEVIPVSDHSGNLGVLLRHLFRHPNIVFHVVGVFLPSSHLLHVARIVVIVVDGRHRSELVEAHDEHTLRVHIGKAKRSYYLRHALSAAIILHSAEKGTTHIEVIDEVEPSEADAVALPSGVGLMVYDTGDAAHDLSVFVVCEIVLRLTEVESWVLRRRKGVLLIHEQVWHIIRIAFIQVIMEVYEGSQLLLCLYFLYFN